MFCDTFDVFDAEGVESAEHSSSEPKDVEPAARGRRNRIEMSKLIVSNGTFMAVFGLRERPPRFQLYSFPRCGAQYRRPGFGARLFTVLRVRFARVLKLVRRCRVCHAVIASTVKRGDGGERPPKTAPRVVLVAVPAASSCWLCFGSS